MKTIRHTITAALLAGAAMLAPAASASADDAARPLTGRVTVEWDKVSKKQRPFQRALRRSGSVQRIVAEINRRYALPNDIPIYFTNQLRIGPAYLPEVPLQGGGTTSFITFPGSFYTDAAQHIRKVLPRYRGKRLKRLVNYAIEFVVAHEIGHALVDHLDLPVTGKEEDAVDGFAAYLLANTKGFGPRSALSAALFFAGLAESRDQHDYADEHSLDAQRVYQFLCWVYGSNPRTFRSLVGKDGLPKQRAMRCTREWRQLNRSWTRLMEPHAKQPQGA